MEQGENQKERFSEAEKTLRKIDDMVRRSARKRVSQEVTSRGQWESSDPDSVVSDTHMGWRNSKRKTA